MPAASLASAGIALFTTGDPLTSSCVASAPTSRLLPSTRMSRSSLQPASETRSLCSASSSLSTGRMLCPPARNLAPERAVTRPTASFTLAGRWNSKSFMSGSLLSGLALLGGLDRAPDLLGGRGHRDVGDAERGQRVDHRVDCLLYT